MLIATQDPEHFKQIAEMVPLVKDADYTPKEFKVWILKNYNPNLVKVLVDVDEVTNRVKSSIIDQVVRPLIKDEIFIPIAYIDPHSNGLGEAMWARLEGFARFKQAKKISIYTKSRVRSYSRKYGLKVGFFCMEKNVD